MSNEEQCGKIIYDIEKVPRPCLRNKGHEGGCNPFSSDATRQKPVKDNNAK